MSGEHWVYYDLPPFFTLQPIPATLQKQQRLWTSVILDHAAWASSHKGYSSVLRLYTPRCELFTNSRLKMTLPQDAAHALLENISTANTSHTAMIDDHGQVALLVTTAVGGLAGVEEGLVKWLLREGSATTLTDLEKNGVVMTFDELVERKCLAGVPIGAVAPLPPSLTVADFAAIGRLTDEQAIRSLLTVLRGRPVSTTKPLRITLFNLDGSQKEPFQGVKFGGQG